MKKIKLEVFESDKPIEPISYCIYTITPKEQISSIQEFMRSAAGKISYRSNTHAFTDDKKIFTLEKISDLNIDDSFEITFEKEETLDILSNRKIYADVADYRIKENLRSVKFAEKYNKYKVSNTITSAYISEIKKALSSQDKQFRLRREYNYTIKISDEKKIQLWLNISSELETNKTICDLINENKCVEGMKVISTWGDISGCGIIKQ